jgi:protein TonB
MAKGKSSRPESLDEIVFANRNKSYGAYDLRKRYPKNIGYSLLISTSVFLAIAITAFIVELKSEFESDVFDENFEVYLESLELQSEEQEDLPPPPPVIQPIEKLLVNTDPVVVDTIIQQEEELKTTDDNIEEENETEEENEENGNGVNTDGDGDVQPFYLIEEQPMFPGGNEKSLMKWIAENTKYPPDAEKAGIQGKVFIEFIIDREGYVTNVQITRGVHPWLDAEALRVIKSMPRWKPGKQAGKPVRVSCQIPINFKLYSK